MKTAIKFLLFCTSLTLMIQHTSCLPIDTDDSVKPKCSGYGYFKVTNGSISTVQVIVIDGTSYGSLTPGRSDTYKLAVGRHTYEIKSANGRGGCSQGSVTIVECDTDGIECRN
jgi:hypothetical protein